MIDFISVVLRYVHIFNSKFDSIYFIAIVLVEKKSFEYGLVNHALVEGLNKFIKKFITLICQLETKFLEVWFLEGHCSVI